MNLKADYMDRYFFWRGMGYNHLNAKKKAIEEMIAYHFIKDENDFYAKINAQEK